MSKLQEIPAALKDSLDSVKAVLKHFDWEFVMDGSEKKNHCLHLNFRLFSWKLIHILSPFFPQVPWMSQETSPEMSLGEKRLK